MEMEAKLSRREEAPRRRRRVTVASIAAIGATLLLAPAGAGAACPPTSCPAAPASDPVPGTARIKLPIERDTIIMSAHDANNDGSWGYGWIKVAQGTNRGLLGADLTAVKDFHIAAARLVFWVAKNNFRSTANLGTAFSVHAFDPPSPSQQWDEGDDRWDQFNLCSNTEWVRAATKVPNYPGATWLCAIDPNTSDNFDTSCAQGSLEWNPGGQYLDELQKAPNGDAYFSPEVGCTTESSDHDGCEYPATNPNNQGPDCDPTCSSSVNCFQAQVSQDPANADPSRCFRRVVIELNEDGVYRLNEARIAAAGCTGGFGMSQCPELHPSWLLKRRCEATSNGGGFHYFSREGAVCILGDKNPSYSGGYARLVPLLEVDVTVPVGQQPPAAPEPVAHCNQYCEGPRPSSNQCAYDGTLDPRVLPTPTPGPPTPLCNIPYDPLDPNETDCRFPCKQGSCQPSIAPDNSLRCDCY